MNCWRCADAAASRRIASSPRRWCDNKSERNENEKRIQYIYIYIPFFYISFFLSRKHVQKAKYVLYRILCGGSGCEPVFVYVHLSTYEMTKPYNECNINEENE